MKRYCWAVILIFYSVLVSASAFAQTAPVLYEHDTYRGRSLEVHQSIADLHLQNMGDKVSSLVVPAGWTIEVFVDRDFEGASLKYKGPIKVTDLKKEKTKLLGSQHWGDRISSIKVVNPQGKSSSFGVLALEWVGVIDNKEGDDPPHGPYGSLHAIIYPSTMRCPGDQRNYPRSLAHIHMQGAVRTGPNKYEWLDGSERTYNEPLSLFHWRSANDRVLVFVYESDPGMGFGFLSGRRHDAAFCAVVSRNSAAIVASNVPANADAVANVVKQKPRWVSRVWKPALHTGMPSMFMRFRTVPR